MTKHKVQVFEQKQVRSAWDEESEKWWFSVVDVVGVLTDSANPTDYLKKLRKRDEIIGLYIGTNCPQVEMLNPATGKNRKTLVGDQEQILRIIQSIPSKKAEPFKIWLAKVGSEFIDEAVDPELAIGRAVNNYRRLGYSENWINMRLKTIEARKLLTDEWDKSGVKEGTGYAQLTDLMYKTWADMSAREYKSFKGLKKENLRDNMTNVELVLNMLAEVSATEFSTKQQPQTYNESAKIAESGASVAKSARYDIERRGGQAISPLNAKQLGKRDDKMIGEGK